MVLEGLAASPWAKRSPSDRSRRQGRLRAAQLCDLAEHGRPYVAARAGELLAALQAKGMLEAESP